MVVLLLIGLFAGVLSGLCGVGGGIVIVPALVMLAQFRTELALGTSLGALLLPFGVLGAYTYYRYGNLDVAASLTIGVGLFFGVWAGARIAHELSPALLQRGFAALMAVFAIRMWMGAGR